jgi:hypothetical protein
MQAKTGRALLRHLPKKEMLKARNRREAPSRFTKEAVFQNSRGRWGAVKLACDGCHEQNGRA